MTEPAAALAEKQTLLLKVYEIFEKCFAQNLSMACAPGCSLCCTQNVTATTLEASLILDELKQSGREQLLSAVNNPEPNRFQPRYTTNDLARFCLNRQEPPEEAPDASSNPCPFLGNNLCLVYEVRPFACRGFFSRIICRPGGEADSPPELIETVTACQQIIEHLDLNGRFGNLSDVTALLSIADNFDRYRNGHGLITSGLPETQPLPGFLIHPDFQDKVVAFLSQLMLNHWDRQTFKARMLRIRPSPVMT